MMYVYKSDMMYAHLVNSVFLQLYTRGMQLIIIYIYGIATYIIVSKTFKQKVLAYELYLHTFNLVDTKLVMTMYVVKMLDNWLHHQT